MSGFVAGAPIPMAKPTPQHMPQLDGLRAYAVLFVMIHHWLPGLLHFEPWGELGVRCFFVLSGFLITGILLRSRGLLDSGKSTLGWQLRQFYIRRSLRIFPIYYLTLIGGVIVGMNTLQETFWWHASYLSNFYFAFRNAWHGYVSHLWSLAVEEQFYLIWPAVLLMMPLRLLPRLLLASIPVAVGFRLAMALWLGHEHLATRVLLPACIDQLLIGALLAWYQGGLGARGETLEPLLKKLWVPAGAVMLVHLVLNQFRWVPVFTVTVGPVVESLFFAVVVGQCAVGFKGGFRHVVANPVAQYFGRISYGLYLYHMFMKYIGSMLENKFGRFGFHMPKDEVAQFFVLLAMSIVAAAASEFLLERPINRLKRLFPTEPGREGAKA